jgi:hypothetical protein
MRLSIKYTRFTNEDTHLPNRDTRIPNGDMRIPNGDTCIPNGDMRIPNGDMRFPNDDMIFPNGDTCLPSCRTLLVGYRQKHESTPTPLRYQDYAHRMCRRRAIRAGHSPSPEITRSVSISGEGAGG